MLGPEIDEELVRGESRLNPAMSMAVLVVLLILYSYTLEVAKLAVLLASSFMLLILCADTKKALRRTLILCLPTLPLIAFSALYGGYVQAAVLGTRVVGAVASTSALAMSLSVFDLYGVLGYIMPQPMTRNLIMMLSHATQLKRSLSDSSLALRSRVMVRTTSVEGLRLVGNVVGSQILRYVYYSHLASLGLRSRMLGSKLRYLGKSLKPIDVLAIIAVAIDALVVLLW